MTVTVEFDTTLAKVYMPKPGEVKQAILMTVPDGVETIMPAEWGSDQKFVGSWMAIYRGGKYAYGSALDEFTESHDITNERENGYVKTEPIMAYRYSGPPAEVVTVLADGTVETKNTIEDGDWLVKWKRGEVGRMTDAKFRSLYVVD